MNNQPPQGPSAFDRDREHHLDDRQRAMQQLQQQEEIAQREREYNERQERDRREREQYTQAPPHQNNAGSLPIHQPVASRLAGAMHSPGGLLANHGGPPPSGPLGAPSGPGNAFGGPLHNEPSRTAQHNPPPAPAQLQQQHQGFGPSILNHNSAPSSVALGGSGAAGPGFGASLPAQHQQQQQQQQEAASRLQQIPFGPSAPPSHQIPGAPALGQGGQQPILNDALSYLDQVKVQFADQPDVYNRFLDIMKDFKSQAIDTPGVIGRVSDLFAGHPNLIQGFNTFLPPGYRIECGTGSDPNTIRVTTPMGTMVQTISGRQPLGETSGSAYYGAQRSNWQQQPQHSIESPEAVFSPQNQTSGPQYSQAHSSYEAQQAAAAHHQQQRGVSQLTNAVATLGNPPRNAQTPTPGGVLTGPGAQSGMEKRGPVEFNHAISYVNKIKNRFQDRPEIYKQFLEILQTYQRESKPIQDVYAQVTLLFGTAPDLLEDFKQFLPESAAQAKAAAAAKAAEEVAALATNAQTPRQEFGKMPAVGNFSVSGPSADKGNKKRQRNATATGTQIAEGTGRGFGGPGKRPKLGHKPTTDAQEVSPTLTPIVPEPLAPTSTSSANQDELAFFDRVKKFIANKSAMSEFLKLCNLFSQDLIDRDTLVHKVSTFIGGSPELMRYFKDMVRYEGVVDQVIENLPKAPTGRISLSNCRALGPSYRLLPKRERLKVCSGRDAMCQQVLNDDWASHPTWASEDSGFVAHRKNASEEGLHRIEEERHDYDFNIEANAKVIQLLEPYGQQILTLDPQDRETYRIPIGLGGSSQAIYKRVLKKIYGEKGPAVADDLFRDPCAVLPVVLARLKQKDEEWRFTQREWEKVWHSQTAQMYLKSLDHMGLQIKSHDKKNLAQKYLIDSIKTKREEQKREQDIKGKGRSPNYQFEYQFPDQGVVMDVLRFMVIYITGSNQHNGAERRRVSEFFEKFIPTFFGISDELVSERIRDIERGTPDDDGEDVATKELPNGRGRKAINGKKNNDLRRNILDRGRNGTRGVSQKEESATGSKESTPDVDSMVEDDAAEGIDEQAAAEVTNLRWTNVPGAAVVQGSSSIPSEHLSWDADKPYEKTSFNLYGNATIYTFFTVFQTLYRRFKDLKECEADAVAEGIRARTSKPAKEIGLLEDKNDLYWSNTGESYYSRTLALVEDFVNGELEEAKFQDYLRHYYLQKGWQLYTVTDLLKQLSRLAATCSSIDSKEKTPDLIEQFYQDRELKEISFNGEINLRKHADKHLKEAELFVIKWIPASSTATIQWLQKDETTFDLAIMERKERWQYYVSSYIRVEDTEGVDREKMSAIFKRQMAKYQRIFEQEGDNSNPDYLHHIEDLVLRICVNTDKIIYKPNTSDSYVHTNKPVNPNLQKITEARSQRFREKFVQNNKWMQGKSHEEVQKVTADCRKWLDGTPADPIAPTVVPAVAPATAGDVMEI